LAGPLFTLHPSSELLSEAAVGEERKKKSKIRSKRTEKDKERGKREECALPQWQVLVKRT